MLTVKKDVDFMGELVIKVGPTTITLMGPCIYNKHAMTWSTNHYEISINRHTTDERGFYVLPPETKPWEFSFVPKHVNPPLKVWEIFTTLTVSGNDRKKLIKALNSFSTKKPGTRKNIHRSKK